ncbi:MULTISPECIES: hypothetical protein [Sphingobium]|uniref:hypothetical protein n=1 Tax=Sphingobium TaxID=165695 RepID=UPI001BED1BF5|nr:hypothetical protein [Sphingobium sp. BHU LFT2]MBT2246802.1 hypothetical protein [Sphingobium sp. BHU LFT2]
MEAAYNRAAYMPRRRDLAQQWANMLMDGIWAKLPEITCFSCINGDSGEIWDLAAVRAEAGE